MLSDLTLVFEDDALLVLDKPAGLLSVPGRGEDKQDCLSSRVQHRYPDALVVHRLDMATSGLMVFARSLSVQRSLNAAFANREVHKRYIAEVDGLMVPTNAAWNTIDLPIIVDWPKRPLRIIDLEKGKPSQTRWRLVTQNPIRNTTRVELEPLTGRSHQLRVHLQALGHPILGDALYASPRVQSMADRLLLHACTLAFAHPLKAHALKFSSAPVF